MEGNNVLELFVDFFVFHRIRTLSTDWESSLRNSIDNLTHSHRHVGACGATTRIQPSLQRPRCAETCIISSTIIRINIKVVADGRACDVRIPKNEMYATDGWKNV